MKITLAGITERKFDIEESTNPRGHGGTVIRPFYKKEGNDFVLSIEVTMTYFGIEKYISASFISEFIAEGLEYVSPKTISENISHFADLIMIAQGQCSALIAFKSIDTQFDSMRLQIETREEIKKKLLNGSYNFVKRE